MRDVFLTCRSFFKRISDFVKYRTATRDMNERYPDATAEEITREDTCIICREEMRPFPPADAGNGAAAQPVRNPVAERMRPKKLPCGHILHFACLRSWLERQQICPTCRRPVVPGPRQAGTVGPPAANAAPGQPIAAVPGQPAADQVNQGDPRPGEGQNRFRMLNLGPLRIGFGAGRGDIVNDLAHQINEQARPAQPENQDHARQYGFGFGFGRPRPPPARAGVANIHTQLDTIEQRLQQEIGELRMAANELNVVRMLEAELNRLRTLRQTAAGQAVHAPTAPLQAPPPGTSPQVTIRSAQTLVANPQQPILTAGSDALPEGLALPHGWTMMPLHRVDTIGHPPAPGMSTSASFPGNNQTTAAHARGPAAHAVFSPPLAPQPPEGTNNVLAGSPSTSNLNLGQARRRDGALDGSGNSTQSLVSESILTNGDVALPGLHSGEVPHVTSSAGTENSATTTHQNHADSTVTLPSLPAWGSSAPPPTPVPSQPSASAQNAGGSTVGEILGDGPGTRKDVPATAPSANGTNHERSNGEDVASSSQDKGKAKAATVEDFIEDVD
jgi:E3 ubiquitin-protein ligase synoviolin